MTFSYERGLIGYDGYKQVNRNKSSVLIDRNDLPLACTVAPANTHDFQVHEPTLEAFEIPGGQVRPRIISADAAYGARDIRPVQPETRIRSNIRVNKRSQNYSKRGRPIWFDPELYKKRSVVERFLSWIEAFRKAVPRYE